MSIDQLILLLIPALIAVESDGDPFAVGDNGNSIGILQIGEPAIKNVNEIHGASFIHADALDPAISMSICTLYLNHWGRRYSTLTCKPLTLEILARIWNGGPNGWKKESTLPYWEKVKKELEKRGIDNGKR